MASNRFIKNWKSICAVLLAGLALSACKNSSSTADPDTAVRDQDWIRRMAEARTTPYPIGKPFTVNGCTVQLHRVAVEFREGVQIGNSSDITISTVDCPTATVSSATYRCGKNCKSDTVQLQPKAQDALKPELLLDPETATSKSP